jgi:hypothetical protein
MRRAVALVTVLVALGGCASTSQNIPAAYVSPILYEKLSCQELQEEAWRVSYRAGQASGQQDRSAEADRVTVAAAAIVFWPSIFFLKGDGAGTAELSRLKGEVAAIEAANLKNNCRIQFTYARGPMGSF